jgi:hypothetical protein
VADESAQKQSSKDIPKLPPGVLCCAEWTKEGVVELTEPQQNAVMELLRKLNSRDSPARREQIIRIWEKRLFDRGFQHILPTRNGGWSLPAAGSGYGYGEEGSKSSYETNIYNSYSQIIIAALTREVPNIRFKSSKPDDDAGITAAQNAEALKTTIIRQNKMLALLEDCGRFLWTDGLAVFHTYYAKDAQRFGYANEEPEEVVPEDEEEVNAADEESEGATDEDSEGIQAQPQSVTYEPGFEPIKREGEDEGEQETSPDELEPNGQIIIECEGAIEWKLPIKSNSLHECGYAIKSKEIDIHLAKAKFPEVAEKITQRKGGPGGDDLDRLARVNIMQGMMDSYNTQDTEANETTWQRAWLRPWQLLEIGDQYRDFFVKEFAQTGLYVQTCGDVFCEARKESMDSCLSLVFAMPGDGMHRPGTGDWLMPVQKVLNNWLELANDYFVRGVPAKWMDNEMFDVDAMLDQYNEVGAVHPFDREPGTQMNEVIFEETPPAFPEQLVAFIQDFKGDLAQLLCGAFPALYGGDTQSNDTMGGITIQRDQALGRIGLPWRRLKEAVATTMMQAVQALAKNHDSAISVTGKISVTVEMADLQGDMYAFPEVDENFPETPTQRQNRVTLILQDAATNPMLGQLIDDPDNLELVKDAVGLDDFVMPQLESRDKQLGEIEVMMRTGPVPNPAIQALKNHIAMLANNAKVLAQSNPQQAQMLVTQGEQLGNQLKQLMQTAPKVSSEDIDPRCDNHEVEALTCLRFINGPKGRAMKNGTRDERDAFENIRLHYIAHDDEDKKQKAAAAPQPVQKPPSISGNIKDMTPDAAAQALAQAGIKTDPNTIAQDNATELAAEHPKEAVPVV